TDLERVALVTFPGGIPQFLSRLVFEPLEKESIEMGKGYVDFDCNFFGFTQLYNLVPEQRIIADIIAITGLNGHAYGSWREKGKY
ncbi:hypothetical protein K469DRAFT_778101, partial [Zopfia rhizophila CBS 207.26]